MPYFIEGLEKDILLLIDIQNQDIPLNADTIFIDWNKQRF